MTINDHPGWGAYFSWWTGRYSQGIGLRVYAYVPVNSPQSAADWIAQWWRQLSGGGRLLEVAAA
ncbi:hypothetical protein [Sphaerisporangium sp. NPDC051011]|uniref:hypothetical protein n=1 Tax=Sphaerisporangium sp. NPDC051011 TaxID=3155792 RepID=UPI0033CD8FD2